MTTTIDSLDTWVAPARDVELWASRLRAISLSLEDAQQQVEGLAVRKKEIMNAAYDDGVKIPEMAEILGVSRERVSIMLGRRVSKEREQVRAAIVTALSRVGAEGGSLAEIHDAVAQGLGYDPGRASIGSYLRTDAKGQFTQVGPATYALRSVDPHDDEGGLAGEGGS
jgi:predicted XRE-type DNA-binding protein